MNDSEGYDSPEILLAVSKSADSVARGEGSFERDAVVFKEPIMAWDVTAFMMWSAARNNGVLNVLDFGGSLGSLYFQNKLFLDTLNSVSWIIVEQPAFAAEGNRKFQSEELSFFSEINNIPKGFCPDIIFFGSSLQYVESPLEILNQAIDLSPQTIVIHRTPFIDSGTNSLTVQKVPSSVYHVSYPMWIFSHDLIVKMLSSKYKLVWYEFTSEGRTITSKKIEFKFKTLVFEKR